MLQVAIDEKELQHCIDLFAAAGDQIAHARASALRKTRRHIETTVKRYVAKAERMPMRAIKDRFYAKSISKNDEELTLWIGTKPVSPFNAGSVEAYGIPGKTGGVKAGRRRYRGAFLAAVYGPQEKIWIRLRSKHFDPELYPTKKRPGDRGMARDHRFPVVKAAIPIDDYVESIVSSSGQRFANEFIKNFKHELHFQTEVKGK